MNYRLISIIMLGLIASNAFSMQNMNDHDLKMTVRNATDFIKKNPTNPQVRQRYQNAQSAIAALSQRQIPVKRMSEELEQAYNTNEQVCKAGVRSMKQAVLANITQEELNRFTQMAQTRLANQKVMRENLEHISELTDLLHKRAIMREKNVEGETVRGLVVHLQKNENFTAIHVNNLGARVNAINQIVNRTRNNAAEIKSMKYSGQYIKQLKLLNNMIENDYSTPLVDAVIKYGNAGDRDSVAQLNAIIPQFTQASLNIARTIQVLEQR